MAEEYRKSAAGGKLTLTTESVRLGPAPYLIRALGVPSLEIDHAQVTLQEDGSALIEGSLNILGYEGVAARLTLSEDADENLWLNLTGAMPAGARIHPPGIDAIALEGLRLDVITSTDPASAANVLHAIVRIGESVVPVTLALPAAGEGWVIEGAFTELPLSIAGIAKFLGGVDLDASLPAPLAGLADMRLSDLRLEVDPSFKRVSRVSVGIANAADWDLVPGRLTLRGCDALVRVDNPTDAATRRVGVTINTRVRVGDDANEPGVGVRIERILSNGNWRVTTRDPFTLPGPSALARMIGADGYFDAILPGKGGLGQLEIPSLAIEFDAGKRTVSNVALAARAPGTWDIVPGLAFGEVELNVSLLNPTDAAARSITGMIQGTITVDGVAVPLALEKPVEQPVWVVRLLRDVRVPGLGQLAGAVCDVGLLDALPQGLKDAGAMTLSNLELRLDTGTWSVASFHLTAKAERAWRFGDEFSIDAAEADLTIVYPGDSARRAVTGRASGTITIAGRPVALNVEKASKDADWTISASLATDAPLSLLALARDIPLGSYSLPEGLPDIELSNVRLTAVPAKRSFSFSADSPSKWPIGLGKARVEVALSHVEIAVDKSKKERPFTATLAGSVTIAGERLDVRYVHPGDLLIEGTLPAFKPFDLFAEACDAAHLGELPMPSQVRDLAFPQTHVRISLADKSLALSTTSDLFEKVAVVVRKSPEGTWGFAAGFQPSSHWRLSSLASELSPLDGINFSGARVILSSVDDRRFTIPDFPLPAGGLDVKRGLSLAATISLADFHMEGIVKQPHLDVIATIGPKLADFMIAADVGGPFRLDDRVTLERMQFRLHPVPPAVEAGLAGEIDVKLHDDTLVFTGGIEFTPNGGTLSAGLESPWNEPFGVKGLVVTHLELDLGVDLEGVPTVGLAGGAKVGEVSGDMAVKFDSQIPTRSLVAVDFKHLKIGDLLNSLLEEVGAGDIPPELRETVLNIRFDDVDFYVAPQRATIGERVYEEGIRFDAVMDVWGVDADAHARIDPSKGISIDAEMDPIDLEGLLKINGARGRAKPEIKVVIEPPAIPTVLIEGSVTTLGLTREVDVELDDNGFLIEMDGKLFGVFEADFALSGQNLKSKAASVMVRAEIKDDANFLRHLRDEVTGKIDEWSRDAVGKIEGARRRVEEAQRDVEALSTDIDAKRREVQAERDAAVRRLEAATRDVESKRANFQAAEAEVRRVEAEWDAKLRDARGAIEGHIRDVERARDSVHGIQREIDDLNAWWDDLPSVSWPWKHSKARDGAYYAAKWGALELAMHTADLVLRGYEEAVRGVEGTVSGVQAAGDAAIEAARVVVHDSQYALDVAEGVLRGCEEAVKFTPIDLDPRVAALIAEQGVEHGALVVAEDALKLVEDAVGGIAQLADDIVKLTLGGIFNLKSMGFEADLGLATGGALKVWAEIEWLGKPYSIEFDFDFHDVESSIVSLAHMLVGGHVQSSLTAAQHANETAQATLDRSRAQKQRELAETAHAEAVSRAEAARPAPAATGTLLVHLQDIGDRTGPLAEFAGTRGQSRRLEGFQINIDPPVPGLGVRYMAHLENVGDVAWVPGGTFCGTRGQSRRLEGFAIELTGERAGDYKLYYMAHLQDLGDTRWHEAGEFCGTRGQSRRVEGISVRIDPVKSETPPRSRGRVTVWEHANFQGRSYTVTEGVSNLIPLGWNDIISAIEVHEGEWEFFEHVEYGGRSWRLGPGRYSWVESAGIPNDVISSFRSAVPAGPRPRVTVWEHANFEGRSFTTTDAASNLMSTGWNDIISAIEVHEGMWEFFEHVEYGGRSWRLGPGRYSWVESAGIPNDVISSFRSLPTVALQARSEPSYHDLVKEAEARRVAVLELRRVEDGHRQVEAEKRDDHHAVQLVAAQGNARHAAPEAKTPAFAVLPKPDPVKVPGKMLVHLQDVGDRRVGLGDFGGTRGESRRLEGFQLWIDPPVPGLGIRYMAHLQDIGDTPWVTGGTFCGTRGQSRRLEGFAIELTGPRASQYKLSYMAHLQDLGDTRWHGAGEFCGTRGESRLVEGIQVRIEPALVEGAKVALKSLANGRYLRVGDTSEGNPRWVYASAESSTLPEAQFILLRMKDERGEEWIGFKSVANELNVQAVPPSHAPGFVLRTENKNFAAPTHTWEHFRVDGDFLLSRVVGGYVNYRGTPGNGPQHMRTHGHTQPWAPAGKLDTARIGIEVLELPEVDETAKVMRSMGRLTVWEDKGFRGGSYASNDDVASLIPLGWNDRISAIEIQEGEWEFFEHVDYGGKSWKLGPGKYAWVDDVGVPNDCISSFRRVRR